MKWFLVPIVVMLSASASLNQQGDIEFYGNQLLQFRRIINEKKTESYKIFLFLLSNPYSEYFKIQILGILELMVNQQYSDVDTIADQWVDRYKDDSDSQVKFAARVVGRALDKNGVRREGRVRFYL